MSLQRTYFRTVRTKSCDCSTFTDLQHCCCAQPVSAVMGGVIRNSHGSVLIFLTLSLLVLTCLQASGSVLTRNIALVNQSRGYSIFILRTFSELASVSLSATISSTLERIKWAMICREGRSRARFVDFLALQDGTSVLGLLSLAAGAAVPSFMTRVWSTIRLIVMLLVPRDRNLDHEYASLSWFPAKRYSC